ncbi:MAG: class I SAM-dependent methyltransferase [Gammaproteobacteria bacterium]|nr:class I SAM-dependent methyltransferase [Gammaproteobacteria bacterium]
MKTLREPFHAFAGSNRPLDRGQAGAPRTGDSPTLIDRRLVSLLKSVIGMPPVEFALWDDGGAITHARHAGSGRITFLTRRALWRTCLRPDMGFCDAYAAGEVRIDGDLIDVMTRVIRSADYSRWHEFRRRHLLWLPLPFGNSPSESRRNIAAHYDLGNDFYRMWLDPDMVYTCAYYRDGSADLATAQQMKMDHVCRKAGLTPGMEVIEAGCGWGALALYMARHYGVRVRAFNISREQTDYGRQQAHELGLQQSVEFIEDDYRNIDGRCDAFVSVGMLEHVGRDHYRELGRVIRRCLSPRGRGLIHSVGRNRISPVNGWIHRRIFPGSYTPSLREMMDIFESADLSVLDVENLRLHYARTLADWLQRFEREVPDITWRYGDYFVRAWRLYLGGCSAAFAAGNLQLFQVVFTPARNNHLPRSRAALYTDTVPDFWEA